MSYKNKWMFTLCQHTFLPNYNFCFLEKCINIDDCSSLQDPNTNINGKLVNHWLFNNNLTFYNFTEDTNLENDITPPNRHSAKFTPIRSKTVSRLAHIF